jgi:hypothetical protein
MEPDDEVADELLLPSEAAREYGKSKDALLAANRAGRLAALRLRNGTRLFRRRDLEAFSRAANWRRLDAEAD